MHTLAALLATAACGWWRAVEVPGVGTPALGWEGLPVRLFWIVGLVNAYNFMDGVDGIAGIQAVVAARCWMAVGVGLGSPSLQMAGVVPAASSAGFLLLNRSPAKVFLGAVGSAFLGCCFAVLPLAACRLAECGEPDWQRRLPAAGLLMVAPVIVDAAYTLAVPVLLPGTWLVPWALNRRRKRH